MADQIVKLNQQNLYLSLALVVGIVSAIVAGTLWASSLDHQMGDLAREVSRMADQGQSLAEAIRADRWTASDMRLWVIQTEALNKDTPWRASEVKPAGLPLRYEAPRK